MKKILFVLSVFVLFVALFSVNITASSETSVPEGYIPIYDKDDLMMVHSNPSGNYILMEDIVFDERDFDSSYNDGMGWIPFESFSGIFDGNGHKIVNLRISGTQNNVGLFGTLTGYASVKNLILENVDIDVSGDYVGGICGKIQTNQTVSNYVISNCRVSGRISGNNYVGGLCGHASSSVYTTCYIIEKSSNLAIVNGEECVGGLLGYHYGYSEYLGYAGGRDSKTYIRLSMNMGSVTASSKAGGIVGSAYESYVSATYGSARGYLYIEDCFNNGSVSANKYSGGIVGEAYCANQKSQINLKNIYNSGLVSSISGEFLGAVCGVNTLTVNNVYYVNSSVQNATSELGTSLTSDKLKITSIGSNWTTAGNKNYQYPELNEVEVAFQLSGEVSIKGEPKCGSVLEIDLSQIQPAFATVDVEWIIDDVIVGEGTTYYVNDEDEGKIVLAKVTGSDDCVGTYIVSIEIELHEHDFTEATCTTPAVCVKCGLVGTEAFGHTENIDAAVEPTCTESGLTEGKSCGACGEILVAQTEIPANGHVWTDDSTETFKTCEICGATEGEKPNPDDNVTPDDDSVEKNHNECEEPGAISRIINMIINIFRQLFGLAPKCYCGEEII
jgi:hypothetical protein